MLKKSKIELKSVEDFFKVKTTVEKYNDRKIEELGWEHPDVLFSFKGIYAIGIFLYYREKFDNNVKIDIKIKDEKNSSKQLLYSDRYLRKHYGDFEDVNKLEEMKKFLKHYYEIGNVIPTWPGANVNRGMSHCYDIPNIYYNRYSQFTEIIYGQIYKNANVRCFLQNEKYDTVEKILNLTKNEYKNFLKYVVSVITERNKLL